MRASRTNGGLGFRNREIAVAATNYIPQFCTTFLTMRFSQPPTLLSLLAIVLSSTHQTNATPLPQDELILGSDNGTLVERTCANPCGIGGLCCGVQQACLTPNSQPHCGDSTAAPATTANNVAGNNGQWQTYTTTYVETDLITRTATYSTYFGSITSQVIATPTTVIAPAVTSLSCDPSLQESPCGIYCCAAGQVCLYQGQCGAAANTFDVSSAYYSSVTNTASAFIRPTSNTIQTVTSTGSPTTTVPFSTPTSTNATAGMASTTNNGLSGGAIAGIVIGVIAGIILLLLICTFFCFKGLLDGFLALLGIGRKRRRTEETYIEERHSHHAGGGGGRTWYGAARPNRVNQPKKSGLGGLGGVAAGLTALAVILGLKRRRDRREKSEYTGSSYSYSDYTSASE